MAGFRGEYGLKLLRGPLYEFVFLSAIYKWAQEDLRVKMVSLVHLE